MSKPSAKKAARQKKKQQQKGHHQKQHQLVHHQSLYLPDFPGEQIGVPTAGVNWLGQKISSFLRIRRPSS